MRVLDFFRRWWLSKSGRPRNTNSIAAHNSHLGSDLQRMPQETETIDLGSGISISLVRIAAGSYTMGSPETESAGRDDNEGPLHAVRLDSFFLGKFPVTVGQFRRYVAETGYRTEMEQQGWQQIWKHHAIQQSDSHPVVLISWNDANRFCQWLSTKSGKRYRLPTEAEWEYAARAGSSTRFFFGERETELPRYAWCRENSSAVTHPVGQLQPNPWGLYDLYGNVREWCKDWYQRDYYKSSPFNNPVCDLSGQWKVNRGESFDSPASWCRSAIRGMATPDNPNLANGFRVARTAEAEDISDVKAPVSYSRKRALERKGLMPASDERKRKYGPRKTSPRGNRA